MDPSVWLELLQAGTGGLIVYLVISWRRFDSAERKALSEERSQQNDLWRGALEASTTRQANMCGEHIKVSKQLTEELRKMREDHATSASRLTALLLVKLSGKQRGEIEDIMREVHA